VDNSGGFGYDDDYDDDDDDDNYETTTKEDWRKCVRGEKKLECLVTDRLVTR
jgi:hypothetical protein